MHSTCGRSENNNETMTNLDDADDDVLQPRPVWVIVEDKRAVLGPVCAAEAWRLHTGVNQRQMVMERVQVLKQGAVDELNGHWRVGREVSSEARDGGWVERSLTIRQGGEQEDAREREARVGRYS